MKCCICSLKIEDKYGHNPAPVIEESAENRCCTWCNRNVVVPVRIRRMSENKAILKAIKKRQKNWKRERAKLKEEKDGDKSVNRK